MTISSGHSSFPVPSTSNGGDCAFELNGCNIELTDRPISSSSETDRLTNHLQIPMPTMLFSHNRLTLSFSPSLVFTFDCCDALAKVRRVDLGMRVPVANEWIQSRMEHQKYHQIVHEFDWTFTPHEYTGTCLQPPESTGVESVDYDLLRRQDKILFYKRLVLYEDELSDHGLALLHVRVRVMPTCVFVLLQFFLRVEGVVFRVDETRFFHRFGSDRVVKEVVHKQAEYQEFIGQNAQSSSGGGIDLMDCDVVSSRLPIIEKRIENYKISLV